MTETKEKHSGNRIKRSAATHQGDLIETAKLGTPGGLDRDFWVSNAVYLIVAMVLFVVFILVG